MSDKLKNYLVEKKVHSQFENELFFRYLDYFTKIKIKYSEKLEKNFFDEKNQTLIIPKNPSFLEIQKIIKFLDNLIKYKIWITAEKKLEKKKSEIKRLWLKTKNSIENSLLVESLYESGKKLVLNTMKAPNSDKLLKDVLNLDYLSKKFNKLSKYQKQFYIRKIFSVIRKYEQANSYNIEWWIPMKFLKNKKLYCIWNSYLLDIIFEKLNIKHYVASWFMITDVKWKQSLHSLSFIKLSNDYYLIDSWWFSIEKIEKKYIDFSKKIIDLRKIKTGLFPWAYFSFWNSETEIIAQNFLNLSLNENNFKKKKIFLEYWLKLSPNNVVIKKELKFLY